MQSCRLKLVASTERGAIGEHQYALAVWLMRFSRSAKVARMSSKLTGSVRYISRIA